MHMDPVTITIAPFWLGVIYTILAEFLGLVLLTIWLELHSKGV